MALSPRGALAPRPQVQEPPLRRRRTWIHGTIQHPEAQEPSQRGAPRAEVPSDLCPRAPGRPLEDGALLPPRAQPESRQGLCRGGEGQAGTPDPTRPSPVPRGPKHSRLPPGEPHGVSVTETTAKTPSYTVTPAGGQACPPSEDAPSRGPAGPSLPPRGLRRSLGLRKSRPCDLEPPPRRPFAGRPPPPAVTKAIETLLPGGQAQPPGWDKLWLGRVAQRPPQVPPRVTGRDPIPSVSREF